MATSSGGWADHAVWWHVYPLGFLGAEHDALPPGSAPIPRLAALEGWLDHLVGLGCNGLALGPVFASETHGYDTVDHLSVDPRLGSEEDLLHLVACARERGVRVLLDGVFNHVGRSFPAFVDVEARGSDSPYGGWFAPGAGGTVDTFEGHHRLVALDHTSPEVLDYVEHVMRYWLERGVSGWRLDAAYAVPLTFWRAVTDRVRAHHPDAWFVGEVIHGDYAAFVLDGGLDSVTQYELWKAVWSSFNDANLFELAWALERHDALAATFAPQTFLGNHDVTRLASQLQDERHLGHALVVLSTVAGVPSVYAGDELAMRGVKEEREGGDDAVRPAFPESPAGLGPDGREHLRLHQELLGLRRRHSWLVRGRTTVGSLTNTAMTWTTVDPAGGRRIAAALNLADEPATLALPPGQWVVAAGAAHVGPEGVTTAPSGWAVLTDDEQGLDL